MVENSTEILVADERFLWRPTTGSNTLVISIPPNSVTREKDRYVVYVHKDGKITAVPVARGIQEIAGK